MGEKIVLILIKCQTDFFLFHHFPHVDECISHPSKGRVYANISYISDFLEAQPRIMAEYNNFPLVVGQLAYKLPDIFLNLPFDHMIFDICFSKFL